MRLPITCIAAVACLLLVAGCAPGGDPVCTEWMESFTGINVYFGMEKGSGETVTEEEWQSFLADTVTPRFPNGLTVLDARGQWFDTDAGRLYREPTNLLNVLVPADATYSSLTAVLDISDVYKQRFEQQAVFYTSLPACAAVY